ncbi:MAG: hypothetical protein BGO26_12050 [Actinobacteria bacterium 69-20]|nr:MAG: hypothetical protein BGO26_12050 [Actinobacteria bacterium 69-20]
MERVMLEYPSVDLSLFERIADELAAARIGFAAMLPDDWTSPLCTVLDRAPEFRAIRVAREPEIIGLCTGCFFTGSLGLGVLGATGFLACASEIATLTRRYQIPMVLVVSKRGTLDDHQVFQEVQGRTARPMADLLGLPSLDLDSPESLAGIGDLANASRLQKRPGIAWLTKALIVQSPTAVAS